MRMRRSALVVFTLVCTGWAEDWQADITSHFVEPHTRENVLQLAKEKNKPAMVIVMTSWCAACAGLRKSVNSGTKAKPLLDKFVVAYAMEEGPANVWTEAGQNYVPQIYFFNAAGNQIHVYNEGQFKYFFADEDHLSRAMESALKLVEQGTVGVKKEDAVPVEGHNPIHDMQASPEPENKVAMYDPMHVFDEGIKGHFLDNLKPEEMRQKALEANRPFMVILTQTWCEACVKLINSVNAGSKSKDLLNAFVISHAHGEDGLANWQPKGEDYVPQALFFDTDGSLLELHSPYPKYKHFFDSDDTLSDAMSKALDASHKVGEL
jgi:thiol-disulfide isomerase/thioredoxin